MSAGTSADLTESARGLPAVCAGPEFVRRTRGKRVLAGFCGPATNTQPTHRVRLAEWSKAPDLSSGSRERAWVRTPHLTIQSFGLLCASVLTDFSFEGGPGVYVQFWNPAAMHIWMHWGQQTKHIHGPPSQIMPILRNFCELIL